MFVLFKMFLILCQRIIVYDITVLRIYTEIILGQAFHNSIMLFDGQICIIKKRCDALLFQSLLLMYFCNEIIRWG